RNSDASENGPAWPVLAFLFRPPAVNERRLVRAGGLGRSGVPFPPPSGKRTPVGASRAAVPVRSGTWRVPAGAGSAERGGSSRRCGGSGAGERRGGTLRVAPGAAGVEAEQPVGVTDDRLGDVADVVAACRQAPLRTPVGMAVDGERGAAAVDRLTEQVAAEERVDLQPLAEQRVGAGR